MFISTEKRYMIDLTMNELFTEYKAIIKKNQERFEIYMTIPKESSLKKEYEDKIAEIYEDQKKIAFEIADRLTK